MKAFCAASTAFFIDPAEGLTASLFTQLIPSSALFVTHGNWYHQKNSFKSIANIPDGVRLAQIREFFLHAMRPDDGRDSPLANS